MWVGGQVKYSGKHIIGAKIDSHRKETVPNTIFINKLDKGICNYTIHLLFASFQLYYVIYL
jgi:hypothetical protein